MQRLGVLVSCFLFEAAGDLAAQGTLTGRVAQRDGGGALGDVSVLVRGTAGSVATSADGRFRIEVLPGTWAVEFRRIGYRPVVLTDVIVRSGRVTTLDASLEALPLRLADVEVEPDYFPATSGDGTTWAGFSSEEIRRSPGAAGDVSRTLQALPSAAKVNDQNNALIVRGGNPTENLFLVDGMEVYNINHFAAQGTSGGALGILNVDAVSSAEMSAGAFGAAWGDRLSSTVDIRLREGNREATDVQLDLNFLGFGGMIEGPMGKRGSWLLTARRSYVDLASQAFNLGTSAIPRFGSLQGKVVLDAGAHRLGLMTLWGDDHIQSNLVDAVDNDMLTFGRQDLVQGTSGASWDAQWSTAASSRTTLAWTHAAFDEDWYETASGGAPLLENRSAEDGLRLRHTTTVRLGRGELNVGGDANRVTGTFRNSWAAGFDAFGNPVPAHAVNGTVTGTRGGIFVSATREVIPRLHATVGLRVDHFTVTGNTTLAPRIALAWEAGERTTLTAASGLYYQSLPLTVLAQAPGSAEQPDMRSWQLVLGVSHRLRPDVRVLVEGYHKESDHLPVDLTNPGILPLDDMTGGYGFIRVSDNLVPAGQARADGVEVTVQKRMSARYYALVAGSYFRSRYAGADGTWRNRAYDNRITLTAEAGVQLGRAWELSARWMLAGGPPYTPIDTASSREAGRTVLDSTAIMQGRLPAYSSVAIRVERRFQVGHSNVRAFLSAWNAFNRKNVAQYFWDGTAGAVEPIYQWSFLPVFGIEWEF